MKKEIKKSKNSKIKYNPDEWDNKKTEFVVPEKGLTGISTSIRLPKEMIEKLKKVARRKGDIGYQTLLKIWIAERLEKETA